jgi:hypothetical protein
MRIQHIALAVAAFVGIAASTPSHAQTVRIGAPGVNIAIGAGPVRQPGFVNRGFAGRPGVLANRQAFLGRRNFVTPRAFPAQRPFFAPRAFRGPAVQANRFGPGRPGLTIRLR